MLVIGGAHSLGSLCGLHCQSELLPVFFSSGSLVLSLGPVLPPSRCCGWWCGHAQLFHSSGHHSLQLVCARALLSSEFSWSRQCIPCGSPCKRPGRPLPSSSLHRVFRHLLLHSHKQLFRGVLRVEDSFCPKRYTNFSNLSLRPRT